MKRRLCRLLLVVCLMCGCTFGSAHIATEDVQGVWVLRTFGAESSPQEVEVDVNTTAIPWIQIDDSIKGFTGCNNLDGFEWSTVEVDHGYLLPGDWVTSAVLCTGQGTDVMAAETAIHSVLMEGRIAVDVSGDLMTWQAAGITLVFEKADTLPPR